MPKTEHEKFEESERERREKEPDADDLRHNYVARTAALRNEADKLGEPPLNKATRVWDVVSKKPLDPPVCICPVAIIDAMGDEGLEPHPNCPQHGSQMTL